MKYLIQIVPIGFEFERVLIGEKHFPSNIYYLLKSTIKMQNYDGEKQKEMLDKKLVEISEEFTSKIKKQLENQNIKVVHVKDCSFINFEQLINDICEVLKEIFQLNDEKNKVSRIYVNVSTSTKLFSTAMMYIASFFTDLIKLFYVSSGNYTTNMLLVDNYKKSDIKKKFEEFGMTYQTNNKGYAVEEIPVVPSILINDKCVEILKVLYSIYEKNKTNEWISLTNILNGLNEDINSKDKSKSIRMKYRNDFVQLMKRKLIIDNFEHRNRLYKLTKEGKIYSLIITHLYEFMRGSKE